MPKVDDAQRGTRLADEAAESGEVAVEIRQVGGEHDLLHAVVARVPGHDDDAARGRGQHARGDAAEDRTRQRILAAGSDDDRIRVVALRRLDDAGHAIVHHLDVAAEVDRRREGAQLGSRHLLGLPRLLLAPLGDRLAVHLELRMARPFDRDRVVEDDGAPRVCRAARSPSRGEVGAAGEIGGDEEGFHAEGLARTSLLALPFRRPTGTPVRAGSRVE